MAWSEPSEMHKTQRREKLNPPLSRLPADANHGFCERPICHFSLACGMVELKRGAN